MGEEVSTADGEVIALFPALPGGRLGECISYVHVGQHGAADHGYVIGTTLPAQPDEYADLQAELVRVGYDDLRVYLREQPWMHRERLDAYLAVTTGSASGDGDDE
jgi:hypothetical protein